MAEINKEFLLNGNMTHKIENNTADSLEIGSIAKGGKVKIYGNFEKVEEFEKKIDNAMKVREYANTQICINV